MGKSLIYLSTMSIEKIMYSSVSLPVIKDWGFANTRKKAWIGRLIRVFQSSEFNGAAISVEA